MLDRFILHSEFTGKRFFKLFFKAYFFGRFWRRYSYFNIKSRWVAARGVFLFQNQ